MSKYKYIQFVETSSMTRKTKIWECLNIKSQNLLGHIEWESGWRQYVFAPSDNCIFSVGCLQDIIHFIEEHKHERTTGGEND
jgi:hypothetical protein